MFWRPCAKIKRLEVKTGVNNKTKLQSLCERRWARRANALYTFRSAFTAVVSALEYLEAGGNGKAWSYMLSTQRCYFIGNDWACTPKSTSSDNIDIIIWRRYGIDSEIRSSTEQAVVVLTFFRSLFKRSDWRFCACAINGKSSMPIKMTKHFRDKCHGLFVNSSVMITY